MIHQKLYAQTRCFNYVMHLGNLRLCYFEVPKTGSSSTKHYLLCVNRGIPLDVSFGLSDKNWRHLFPEAFVQDYASLPRERLNFVVLRDPVSRIKSAFWYIYKEVLESPNDFTHFARQDLPVMLRSGEDATLLNHVKPQHWFFPRYILESPHSFALDFKKLDQLPAILERIYKRDFPRPFPHVEVSKQEKSEIGLSDAEIRSLMPAEFDADFEIYQRYCQNSEVL